MKTYRAFAALVLIWLALANQAGAAPVLMISIDGLSPEYVLKADAHGLKLPTLRRFLTEGAYSEGVIGVVPTVTYPSHTTLVTGVWPVEHGILANVTFNPGLAVESWYWYAEDIRVPTLWDVAQQARMVTASVSWPVTVGAKSVKYLIPEYWRVRTPNDHKLMEAISRPDGMLAEMEERLGPYIESTDQGVPGDRIRTKFSLDIISRQKPGFMTIHLAALDHLEHETGPFSKESDETAEAIDEMVGQLTKAALANDPSTTIVVVSDHGFLPVSQHINLMVPFVKEGLIRIKDATASAAPRITSWDAAFWGAGGSAAVVLRDPSDAAVKAHVRNLLTKMKGDPQYQIARVIEQPELAKMGGFPDAAFLVEMNPGAEPGYSLVGETSTPAPGTGTHGYLPDRPEMRASFFVMGQKIAAGRDVGVIDMRQVAPTVAGILGVSLPTAKAAKLSVWQ
ncbi:MAG TPA: ectonucleotide pyrophosphatase/phosphodiesterase [Candidatus Acidoferrales bacterium]|jgi:predicted AlkP superfamily pyrophosphatase or phosphodiesterase|nr:ectonucleotide pyrophosphatase/phosphodiesterase [Candidatus Acidoferrales bacterium]